MNPKNIDNVIKELTKAEHAYYVLNSPIMSDGEYDKLFNELKQYEIANPSEIKTYSPKLDARGISLKEAFSLLDKILEAKRT